MSRSFVRTSAQYLTSSAMPVQVDSFDGGSNPLHITLAAWIKPATVNTSYPVPLAILWDYFGTISGVFFQLVNTKVQAVYVGANSYVGAESTATLSAGTWYHIAAVYTKKASPQSGYDWTIYVDGGSTATASDNHTALKFGNSYTRIGWYNYSDNYFNGDVAEVGIWQAELDAAEIGALAKGMSPLGVRPASLEMYVPLVRDADGDLIGGVQFSPQNTPTVSAHPRVLYPARVHSVDLSAGAAATAARAMMHYKRLRTA